MGAGIARQARDMYPDIDLKIGGLVAKHGNRVMAIHKFKILTFPTKGDWKQHASLDMICRSAQQAVEVANKFGIQQIAMSAPGCGNGGLQWAQVGPQIARILDDRFVVVI